MRCPVLLCLVVFAGRAAEWRPYQDAAGFSLEVPSQWRVEPGRNGMATVSSPDGRSFAQVIPVLNRQQPCAALLTTSFQVSSQRFPQARVVQVQPGRDQRTALAEVSFAGGQSRAAVLCVETSPRSAMLYTIAAPQAEFAMVKPTLIRTLTSFQYRANAEGSGGAAPTMANLQYVRWSDPRENAFSLQVPAGWQTAGGVIRYTNLEIGSGVRTASPDGNSVIVFNDPRIRTAMTPIQGARVGSPAYGGGVFLPYVPGLQFAETYLRQYLLGDAGMQLQQVISKRERPDLSAISNQAHARGNVNPAGPTRTTHGEIVFTAVRNGQKLSGYLLAATDFTPSMAGMGHIWRGSVFAYVAPEAEVNRVTQVVSRMMSTAQLNAAWSQGTQAAGRATQEAFHSAAQQANEAITSSYWARQGVQGQAMQNGSETMRGQIRLTDGQGTQYVAPSGKNYYYLDEVHGRVVGTNDTAPPPNIDVRQLEMIR